MSFTARLADIDLTLDKDKLDLGSPRGESRTVSFTAVFTEATKDLRNAAIAKLNERLATPCDLVVQTTDATYPVAIHLLGNGDGKVQLDGPYELGAAAFVDVTCPCAPYATPANRVFLAAPIGDEWPDSADVERDDEDYVYADGGRWRIDGVNGATGTMTLYGDCTADEQLVVEVHTEVETINATAFTVVLTWLTSAGATVGTETKTLRSAVAVGEALRTWLLRVPDTAVRFKVVVTFSAPTGACTGYIRSIRVGEKLPACPMSAPLCAQVDPPYHWSVGAWPEHEYERYPATSGGGATWSHASYYSQIAAVALAAESYQRTNHYIPVMPGRPIGLYGLSQCTAYTDGTAYLGVWWYDADLNYISFSAARTVTAADGGVVTTFYEATPPAAAFFAKAGAKVAADSDLTFKFSSLTFGEHVLEAPGDVALTAMQGEVAAPLEVWGDVDIESDAHRVDYAVAPLRTVWLWEGEVVWSALSLESAASHAGYTARTNSTVGESGSFDTAPMPRGSYTFMAFIADGAHTASVDFPAIGAASAVTTALTTRNGVDIEPLAVPVKRVAPGTTALVAVTLKTSNAANYAYCDFILALAENLGGHVSYHPSATTDADSVDVKEDGTILIDGAANREVSLGDGLLATASDKLCVHAEKVAVDEPSHAVVVVPLHRPRYSLWRDA